MLAGYDVVLISTDHDDYDYDWIVQNAKLVVDTRNATASVRKGRRKIKKA
jgi:UDP-N-acetyl-D-glucosamine dehydrogenase